MKFELDFEGDDMEKELTEFAHKVGDAIFQEAYIEETDSVKTGVRERAFRALVTHLGCNSGMRFFPNEVIGELKKIEKTWDSLLMQETLGDFFGERNKEAAGDDEHLYG